MTSSATSPSLHGRRWTPPPSSTRHRCWQPPRAGCAPATGPTGSSTAGAAAGASHLRQCRSLCRGYALVRARAVPVLARGCLSRATHRRIDPPGIGPSREDHRFRSMLRFHPMNAPYFVGTVASTRPLMVKRPFRVPPTASTTHHVRMPFVDYSALILTHMYGIGTQAVRAARPPSPLTAEPATARSARTSVATLRQPTLANRNLTPDARWRP